MLFIGGIGGPELMIVLLIAVFLFGANKLPKLARSSGQAIGEFHKGREEIEAEIRESAKNANDSSVSDGTEDEVIAADETIDADEAIDGDVTSPEANPA